MCFFCTFSTQFEVKLFRPHLPSSPFPQPCHHVAAAPQLVSGSYFTFLFFVLMVCPSVLNPALWLSPEKLASWSGRHTWQLCCASASPPWHLAGYVFSAVTKAERSGVTLLTDIKKFLGHAHPHAGTSASTHTRKHGRWPLHPKHTRKHRGSRSEMKLKFQTRLRLWYPPVKTD